MKRMTPPFADAESEQIAAAYGQAAEPGAGERAMAEVSREFWKWRGVDGDARLDLKVLRQITFEQKNREHEEFHRLFAEWKAKKD